MYRWCSLATLLLGLVAGAWADYPGVGRPATQAELALWDSDIGPDLQRLPAARGSVLEGQAIYAAQCAACHGDDGRATEIFYALAGGVSAADVASGRVAGLQGAEPSEVSTFMLLPSLTTLLDYTARAMPFGAGGSLSTDEVFAVTAYLLHLAGVVDGDFVLDRSSAELAQQRLPNRNGFSTDHGLWPGAAAVDGGMGNGGIPEPDTVRCMADCDP